MAFVKCPRIGLQPIEQENPLRHTTCRLRLAALLPACFLLAFAAASADEMRIAKKLIAAGWDHPDSQRFRQHLTAIEKRPFDGVVVEAPGRNALFLGVSGQRSDQDAIWHDDIAVYRLE
ncbi:MAG: hypothetical protein KJZ87_00870 [Thermoguttaceae bacterium]|nr:hypothetical protein [Thermoguttaceae bacterium]